MVYREFGVVVELDEVLAKLVITVQLASPGEHVGSNVSPAVYGVVGGAARSETENEKRKKNIKDKTNVLLA